MEEYVNWFWVESDAKEGDNTPQRGGSVGTWKAVKSEEGLQQGSPLACFAAALGGVKCILAARKAMDDFHALSREAPATMSDQQKEAVYKLAATASEATAYLDDAALLSKMAALCKAHLAYVKVCQGRNWLAKPEKSIVTADYYSDEEPRASTFVVPPGPEDSMLSEELNCREGEGVPPEQWDASTGESEGVDSGSELDQDEALERPAREEMEPPADTPETSATDAHGHTGDRDTSMQEESPPAAAAGESPAGKSPTVRSVELAPGVEVTQACEGFVMLGTPIGSARLRVVRLVGTSADRQAR